MNYSLEEEEKPSQKVPLKHLKNKPEKEGQVFQPIFTCCPSRHPKTMTT
jgi:hypothetical protein